MGGGAAASSPGVGLLGVPLRALTPTQAGPERVCVLSFQGQLSCHVLKKVLLVCEETDVSLLPWPFADPVPDGRQQPMPGG